MMHKKIMTNTEGHTVWVNPTQITYMCERNKNGEVYTSILFSNGDIINVSATIEQIMNHLQ